MDESYIFIVAITPIVFFLIGAIVFLVADAILYGENNVQVKNIILTWMLINDANSRYQDIWNALCNAPTFKAITCGNRFVMQRGYVYNLLLIVDELSKSSENEEWIIPQISEVTKEKVFLVDMARKSKHLRHKYVR